MNSFVYQILILATIAATGASLSDKTRLRGSPTQTIGEAQQQDSNNVIDQRRGQRGIDSQLHKTSFTGKLSALMIRVIDSNYAQPDKSVQELQQDVFFDEISLKTQIEACSYKKLKINPFKGHTSTGLQIQKGVADIMIDYDFALGDENDLDLETATFQAANRQIGDLETDAFDIVMFCLPPNESINSISSQIHGTKYSFFSNEHCSSVSSLMHEVGHTLGLGHSGKSDGHNDHSGMMGANVSDSDFARCFNPAKNYQLGWYEDQSMSIDPLTYKTEDYNTPVFTLNGVSDYGKSSDALVVLKLEQRSRDQAYYIGYNRADGINADTPEDEDMVTIYRTNNENGKPFGSSTMIASLHLGQSYTITDFNGESERDVEVRVVGLWEETANVEIIDLANSDIDRDFTLRAPCSDYTIEVKTDNYPMDTYWIITENRKNGRLFATSPQYTESNTVVTQIVCLPNRSDGVQYNFQIYDGYGDGITGGYYKVTDSKGAIIFMGDEEFLHEEHLFDAVYGYWEDQDGETSMSEVVEESPPSIQTQCKDTIGKIRFHPTKGKKRSCKWIAKNGKCNRMIKGKYLYDSCQKSCGVCNKTVEI